MIYRVQLITTGHILEAPASECTFEPFVHQTDQANVTDPSISSSNPSIQASEQAPGDTSNQVPAVDMSNTSIQALIAKAMEIVEPEPKTYDQAIRSPDKFLWKRAIRFDGGTECMDCSPTTKHEEHHRLQVDFCH